MTSTLQSRSAFLPAFEGLRGAAALGVVVYHLHKVEAMDPLTGRIPLVFTHGWILVDLFFALSGWILAHVYYQRLLADQPESISSFALARFARIYPLFFVVLCVQALIWAVVDPSGNSLLAAAFLRQLMLAFTWGPLAENPIVAPSWSISAEVLLYFLFPFLVLARTLKTKTGALIMIFAGVAIYFWLALDLGSFQQSKGLSPIRALGGFLFGFGAWRMSKDWGHVVDYFLMFGLIYAISMPHSELIILMLLFLVMNRLRETTSVPSRIFSTRPMQWLGRISYSLYLWHWLGIVALIQMTKTMQPIEAALVVIPVGIAVFAISALSYRTIEIPARRFIVGLGLKRREKRLLKIELRKTVEP